MFRIWEYRESCKCAYAFRISLRVLLLRAQKYQFSWNRQSSGVSVRLREPGCGEVRVYIKANRSSTDHFALNVRDAWIETLGKTFELSSFKLVISNKYFFYKYVVNGIAHFKWEMLFAVLISERRKIVEKLSQTIFVSSRCSATP